MLTAILLSLFLSGNTSAHPLKMCVCDVKYRLETRHLTFKFKFFWDDLEAYLEKQSGRDLTITAQTAQNDQLLADFVTRNFLLTINGVPVKLRHTRNELNDVVLAVEFQSEAFTPADTYQIDLSNTILLDAFPDQYNLVRFDFFGNGNLESLRFERAERRLTKRIAR